MHAYAQVAAPLVPPRLSADECAVWARESSFATSVSAHDAKAFLEHLHPGAEFGPQRPQPTRGSAAIAKRWAAIIEGKTLKLSWYPAMVAIGGEADIAYSSGPSLYEDFTPGADPRFSIGSFHSIWHRGGDGVWRVLFDDGVGPKAATVSQVDAFHAGRKTACPPG